MIKKLYKGFVECRGKIPTEKFKDTENLKTLEEIRAAGVKEFSGVLAKNVLLLDFDEEEHAAKALELIKENNLKCKVIKTRRGIHALFELDDNFKNAATHKQLACGLVADIKTGKKNGLEYLKENGTERTVIYDTEEYETAPYYFRPTADKDIINFIEMGEGDGRNDNLYKYIIKLLKVMEKEEAKETIKLINNKILADKLPESEIKIIIRDESFDKIVAEAEEMDFFGDKGSFKFDVFAKYLINKKKIIKINNQLYIYKDGIYANGTEWIEREMIKAIPRLSQAKRKEVFSYLKLLIEEESNPTENNNLIAFKNGLYDITTKTLKPFDDKYIITNKVDWNYNPDAYSEPVNDLLNKISCKDEEIRKLLEEMVGYTFFRQNEMGKAFILVGPQANGKSTFQQMLQKLLNIKNISSIDLKDLNERFKTAELYGKLANIGDDIGDNYIDDNNMFKTIVTGGRVIAERKGQDPFEFEPFVKLIYSANNIPKTRDRTGAVKRRLIIIPFDRVFKPTDPDYDPYIRYKITNGTDEYSVDDNMSYLINIALAGLHRVLENNKFTICQKVEQKINEYDKDNNPIKIWFDELGDPADEIELKDTIEIYNKYIDFCNINGLKSMSKIEFSKTLKQELGLGTKVAYLNGKTVRVYYR